MAVNRQRKIVWDQKESVDLDGLTFNEAIDRIRRLQRLYGDASTKLEEDYMDVYSDSDRRCLYVYVSREENDTEYAKRIAQEEHWDNIRQQNERAEFERLSKLYGDKK